MYHQHKKWTPPGIIINDDDPPGSTRRTITNNRKDKEINRGTDTIKIWQKKKEETKVKTPPAEVVALPGDTNTPPKYIYNCLHHIIIHNALQDHQESLHAYHEFVYNQKLSLWDNTRWCLYHIPPPKYFNRPYKILYQQLCTNIQIPPRTYILLRLNLTFCLLQPYPPRDLQNNIYHLKGYIHLVEMFINQDTTI